jgi:MFS family permease
MVIGAALFAGSFAALAIYPAMPVILATAAVMSVAECLFSPLATAAAAEAAPKEAQGRASALFQLSWGAAVAVGPLLLTSLLTLGLPVLWTTLTITSLAAIPAVIATRSRPPRQSGPPAAQQHPRADVQK